VDLEWLDCLRHRSSRLRRASAPVAAEEPGFAVAFGLVPVVRFALRFEVLERGVPQAARLRDPEQLALVQAALVAGEVSLEQAAEIVSVPEIRSGNAEPVWFDAKQRVFD
jgi:hypothetical protein